MSVQAIKETILVTTLMEALKKDLEDGVTIKPDEKHPVGKHVQAWIKEIAEQIQ